MSRRVAIVTDSTASVPTHLAEQLQITVVQLELSLGEEVNDERRIPHPRLAEAMRGGTSVGTAPPPPPAFFWNYMDAVSAGAEAIVSVHLSESLSRTCESARIAAADVDIPVYVVDSRLCGLGLGYPVIAAAEAAARGASVQGVLTMLDRRLRTTTQVLYVDTLEYLERGGRVGKAQAMLGQTFSLRPVLALRDGELEPVAKGVGAQRALKKAVTYALGRAGSGPVNVATEHFVNGDRAESVLSSLRSKLPQALPPLVAESSAIIGAHVGPGALGITVSPAT